MGRVSSALLRFVARIEATAGLPAQLAMPGSAPTRDELVHVRGFVARSEAEQRARSSKGGRKSRSTDPTRSVEKVSMKISGT
jgi:hypothetical protein